MDGRVYINANSTKTSKLFTLDTVEKIDSQTDERFSKVYELSSVKAGDVAWNGIVTKKFGIFTLRLIRD
jgi:hypothetical protein